MSDLRRPTVSAKAIALLSVGLLWCAVGPPRAIVAQTDRLTPIQREIQKQQQRLSADDVEERRDALMRLGNLKRPDASRAAAFALKDKSEAVRVAAAHAVSSLPPAEAANLLIPLLKDKSEFVRREAAFALGDLRDRSATAPLLDALHDKKPSVRAAAAIALGLIRDEAAVVALSEVLTASQGTKSKNSEEEFVKRSAARSLGQIRSRAAVSALVATLQDVAAANDTRREAAVSLGLIADSSALPALRAAIESTTDPYLADAARIAIRVIEHSAK